MNHDKRKLVSQPNAFGGFSGKVGRFLALSKKYTTKIFVNLFQVFNTNTGFSDVERFRGEPECKSSEYVTRL